MPTIDEAFQIAINHHRAGRLAEAEEVYGRILAVAPHHLDSLFNRGFAQQIQGKLAAAATPPRSVTSHDANGLQAEE